MNLELFEDLHTFVDNNNLKKAFECLENYSKKIENEYKPKEKESNRKNHFRFIDIDKIRKLVKEKIEIDDQGKLSLKPENRKDILYVLEKLLKENKNIDYMNMGDSEYFSMSELFENKKLKIKEEINYFDRQLAYKYFELDRLIFNVLDNKKEFSKEKQGLYNYFKNRYELKSKIINAINLMQPKFEEIEKAKDEYRKKWNNRYFELESKLKKLKHIKDYLEKFLDIKTSEKISKFLNIFDKLFDEKVIKVINCIIGRSESTLLRGHFETLSFARSIQKSNGYYGNHLNEITLENFKSKETKKHNNTMNSKLGNTLEEIENMRKEFMERTKETFINNVKSIAIDLNNLNG